LQKEVAEALGVEVNTVVGWEIGRAQPKVSYLPRIIAFLGYDPFPAAVSLGERLRAERQRRGLTQHQLARHLSTTQAMVSLLETGGEVTNGRLKEAVGRFLREGRE